MSNLIGSDLNAIYASWLSLLVFLPALGALLLVLIPARATESLRYTTFAVTAVTFLLTLLAFFSSSSALHFATSGEATKYMQSTFHLPWIPSFDIYYAMGVDGISLPLVVLTGLVSLLAMGASWSITKHVKAYCILFLLLETGMLGVFLALDFFLFYVFWEVMLLPMYFLIGVWGGPRREYAAIKFFIYTLVGSVLMLIAILMLYFASDLTKLTPTQLARAHVLDTVTGEDGQRLLARPWQPAEGAEEAAVLQKQVDLAAATLMSQIESGERSRHTFSLLALAELGQHTDAFSPALQWWAFLLLFIGFAIKVPSVPVHTWLPDAHVEAPTPISMILAGVLLKMGGYGILRICYPICPHGGFDLAWFICLLGVVSMIYGAYAALAQKDFKRLVAYSSVSHMGYVVLGLGVWSATAGTLYNPDYWNMGVKGAMFQMIAHGISSAGMFFMVGVVYDRVHHRNLSEFGGLFGKMPLYTALAIGIFFAGLGLPGLCGFIGEVLVVLSVWNYSQVLAILAAAVVILTAGYILWTLQRVYLGAEYKGPHEEALVPITPRETTIAATLFVLAILLGVFPYSTVLKYMDGTIDRQTQSLAEWTQRRDAGEEGSTEAEANGEQVTIRKPHELTRRGDSAASASVADPASSESTQAPAGETQQGSQSKVSLSESRVESVSSGASSLRGGG